MVSDKIKFIFKVFKFFIPFSIQALYRQISIVQHRWTYQAVPFAKEVVVIGGSFAGVQLARRLSESLPTGYKVTMIEKNSHFNFLFNFPRFSVLPRREQQAFIPYDGIVRAAPPGALRHVRDTVTAVTTDQIYLASGEEISYAFVVIATGSTQPLPAKTVATDRDEACAELRTVQDNIQQAKSIAVIGGGAVGVELVSDIKSFYPDKEVSLFHSRNQLLPRFGPRLHDHVLQTLTDMGIHVILNERPQLISDQKSIQLADGRVAAFDFIVSIHIKVWRKARELCRF
jgi:apoptosis-inducing factor 2